LDTLVDQARNLLDADWRAAEVLAQQALELDPNHVLAKSLRTLASDRKREEAVDACLSQVRRLQAAGDLEGALAQLQEGLAAYPMEPRLIQACDTLRKESTQSPRLQARHRDLEELRRLEQDAKASADPEKVRSLYHTATVWAGRYPDDVEFQSFATSIGRRVETLTTQVAGRTGADSAKVVGDSPGPASGEVAEPPSPPETPSQENQAPEAADVDVHANLLQRFRSLLQRLPNPRWLIAAAGIATVIVVAAVLAGRHRPQQPRQQPPSLSMLDVDVTTTPPGAALRIDGQDQGTSPRRLKLKEGSHQLEALMDGYQPLSKLFTVPHAPASPVTVTLQALPLKLQLFTKVGGAQVELDGQPAGNVADGRWTLESVDPGVHTLRVTARGSEANVSFEGVPADVPALSGPPTTKGLRVVTVSTFASRGFVQFSFNPGKRISVDDQPAAESREGRLELKDLAKGAHILAWENGQARSNFDCDSAAVLTVFLEPESTTSTTTPTSKHGKPEPPAPPPPNEITRLQGLALDAYKKGSYIEPPGESAVDYSNGILKLDPGDQWAKDMIGRSVKAQRSVILRAAIESKDFGRALQQASILRQRFPDLNDGEELEQDIKNAKGPEPRPPAPPPPPAISLPVRYVHEDKTYQGTLSVSGHQMKFVGQSTSAGPAQQFTIACSDIRDISKNREVFSHHGTFHVRTTSNNYNFVPEDGSSFNISALKSACSQ
jgi:hypothetical protein